jgi:hypothetical protein
MAEYLIQSETLDDIADAINAKTGGSSAMTPAEMVTAIGNIETGGGGETQAKFTGTVTFVGQDVHDITVPISGVTLTGGERVLGICRALRTGEIVNGEVEWYQNLTVPLFTGSNGLWTPHFYSVKNLYFPTADVYYANGTKNSEKNSLKATAYRQWQNNNGGTTGGAPATVNTKKNTITIGVNSEYLCRTSCAAEYEYIIFVLCNSGTYD